MLLILDSCHVLSSKLKPRVLPLYLVFEKLSPQIANLSVNINAGGAIFMGAPSDEAASSNVMTLGLSLGYPILF